MIGSCLVMSSEGRSAAAAVVHVKVWDNVVKHKMASS